MWTPGKMTAKIKISVIHFSLSEFSPLSPHLSCQMPVTVLLWEPSGAFLQIWGTDAKRALRQPGEVVVVGILEGTEYLSRNRNSKQKEAVECKHSSLGTLKTLGKDADGGDRIALLPSSLAEAAMGHGGLTASSCLASEPHGAHAEAVLPLAAPRQ